MAKISLRFMNRLEKAIFKNLPDDYLPVSSRVALSVLVAAVASIVVIFILQMINASEKSATIVLSIAFGTAFLYSSYLTYKAITCLSSIGAKVGLAAYVLVLFAICSFLFIWLAVWAMIIALVILVGWIILKVAFPDKSGKKKITTRWSDGKTIEMEETGRGITGETYYEGEGRTHVEP